MQIVRTRLATSRGRACAPVGSTARGHTPQRTHAPNAAPNCRRAFCQVGAKSDDASRNAHMGAYNLLMQRAASGRRAPRQATAAADHAACGRGARYVSFFSYTRRGHPCELRSRGRASLQPCIVPIQKEHNTIYRALAGLRRPNDALTICIPRRRLLTPWLKAFGSGSPRDKVQALGSCTSRRWWCPRRRACPPRRPRPPPSRPSRPHTSKPHAPRHSTTRHG